MTDAHKWVLGYLAVRQLESGPYGDTYWISAKTLIHRMPVTLLHAHSLTSVQSLIRLLAELEKMGALQYSSGNGYYAGHGGLGYDEDTSFVLTSDGLLKFRMALQPLAAAVASDNYKKVVKDTKGDSKIKKEMQQLQGKLKDRAENEIIDAFMTVAKQYGPRVVVYLIDLVNKFSQPT